MENPMENPEHKPESLSSLSKRIRREFRAEMLATGPAVQIIRPPGQTGAAPLVCPLCGYGFAQGRPLERYLSGGTVQCSECRGVFSWRGEIFGASKLSPGKAFALLLLLNYQSRPPGIGEIAAAVAVSENTVRRWRDSK